MNLHQLRAYSVHAGKALELEIPRNAALTPNGAPLFQVALLTGDVPRCRNVSGRGCLGLVGLDENLVVQEFGRAPALQFLEAYVVHARYTGAASSETNTCHLFL